MNNTAKMNREAAEPNRTSNLEKVIRVYQNGKLTGKFDPPESESSMSDNETAKGKIVLKPDSTKEEPNEEAETREKPNKTGWTPRPLRRPGRRARYMPTKVQWSKMSVSDKICLYARLFARLIASIILCGILINIAAEAWPGLKTEIPAIYSFYNGLLKIVEAGFGYVMN